MPSHRCWVRSTISDQHIETEAFDTSSVWFSPVFTVFVTLSFVRFKGEMCCLLITTEATLYIHRTDFIVIV